MVNLSFDIDNTSHIERFCGNAQQLNLDSSRLFQKAENWYVLSNHYQDDALSIWSEWLAIQRDWIKEQLTEIGWAAHQSAIAASMIFFDDLRKLVERVDLSPSEEPWIALAESTKAEFGWAYNRTIHDKIKWGINTEREAMVRRAMSEQKESEQAIKSADKEEQINNICSHLTGRRTSIYRFLVARPRGVTFQEYIDHKDNNDRPLTRTNDQNSIERALRTLSGELISFKQEVHVSKSSGIIQLKDME